MKRSILITLTVLGTVTGLTVITDMWDDIRPMALQAKIPPSVEVLVVARDVPAGAVLGIDDLRYEYWPAELAEPPLVARPNGGNVKMPYIGRVTRHAMTEGEPFTADALGMQAAAIDTRQLSEELSSVAR